MRDAHWRDDLPDSGKVVVAAPKNGLAAKTVARINSTPYFLSNGVPDDKLFIMDLDQIFDVDLKVTQDWDLGGTIRTPYHPLRRVDGAL